MARVPMSVCAAAALALAACSTVDSSSSGSTFSREAKVVAPSTVQPGTGVVSSVAAVAGPRDASASAGSSRPLYRLFINMDNGRIQTVDVDNPSFNPRDRVQVTPDGRVVRVSGAIQAP